MGDRRGDWKFVGLEWRGSGGIVAMMEEILVPEIPNLPCLELAKRVRDFDSVCPPMASWKESDLQV